MDEIHQESVRLRSSWGNGLCRETAPRLTDSQASHSSADLSRGPCVRDLSPTGLAGPKDRSTICVVGSAGRKLGSHLRLFVPSQPPNPPNLVLSLWVPHTQVCATIIFHLATLRAPSLILTLLTLSPHFSVNKDQNILSFSLFPAWPVCLSPPHELFHGVELMSLQLPQARFTVPTF